MSNRDQSIIDLSNTQTKRTLLGFIRGAEGLYWFEMRRCKDQRSLEQNAYFHGALLPAIAPRLNELWGERVDVAKAKKYLKDEYLRFPVMNKDTGEIRGYITKDTHDLDESEFATFLDEVVKFATTQLDIPYEQIDPELWKANRRRETAKAS